jgi:hypothetical protein
MLKTSTSFEESVNYMIKDLSISSDDGIKYQTSTMDSSDFNTTMNVIESKINVLYEKTRLLDDIITYAKEYIKNTIYENSKEIKSIVNEIEDESDSIKNSSYISYDVPFTEGDGSYIDRNGVELSHSVLSNGVLTSSKKSSVNIKFDSIQRISSTIPYRQNLDDLIKGTKPYRSFYFLDSPMEDGFSEEIKIKFQYPVTINYIDAITSNCKESDVKYYYNNTVVETSSAFVDNIGKNKYINAVSFKLNTNLYTLNKYNVDTSMWANDFWSKIADMEYSSSLGLNNSVYDLDVIAGMSQYRKYYQEYIYKLQQAQETTAPIYISEQEFNIPVQSLSSNIKEVTKYEYFFGLDKIDFCNVEILPNSCFISKSKTIGTLDSDEYIQLDATYNSSIGSSVEFYIVDGSIDIPILPTNITMVTDEVIFYGKSTRFQIDNNKDVIIKKDGQVINLSIEEAIKMNDGLYTVSYTPVNAYKYRPINNTIKVKVIQRLFDDELPASNVSKVKIRKYGGNALWKNIQ